MRPLGPHVLVFLGPVPTDEFGDPIGDGAPAEHRVAGCALYPRGQSTEAGRREGTVIVGMTAIVPRRPEVILDKLGITDPDAFPTLQIRTAEGRVFEVEGDVGPHTFNDGRFAGTEMALTKATNPR